MSVWQDKKFLNLVAVRLERFVWKNANLANHRCPICGDSKKNKLKARGYHYVKTGGLYYSCKNCGASMTTSNFIKTMDPELHKEYVMERYMEGGNGFSNYQKPKAKDFGFDNKALFKETSILDKLMDNVSSLPDDHIAKAYVLKRKIPEIWHKELYFIDDTQKLGGMSTNQEKKFEKHHEPRLVIPFYGRDGKLTGVSGRSLVDVENQLRYLTVRLNKDVPLIFNLDRVDYNEKIYVTEGPIDSMYLANAVASGSTNLSSVITYLPKNQCVLIYDYQPRNKELLSIIKKAIKQNFAVALLPANFPGKDIGAAIESGLTQDQLTEIIDKNTFKGLSAEIEFARWAKVKK